MAAVSLNLIQLGFIDNFNLFWEFATFFGRDGIHSCPQGSSALTANILHAVSTTTGT